MDSIHNKWRKAKGRSTSKKGKQLAQAREKKKEKSEQEKNQNARKTTLRNPCLTPVNLEQRDEFFMVHASNIADLAKKIMCSECGYYSVCAQLSTDHQGLSVIRLKLVCENCQHVLDESYSSPRLEDSISKSAPFKVNRKVIEATNNVGLGYAALERFCVESSMKPPSSKTFRKHLTEITKELVTLEKKILTESRNAVRKAYEEQDSILQGQKFIDIVGLYDGTWPKRGHTSLFGVGIVIDLLTGSITDFEILSKYCHMCVITVAELDPESPEYDIGFQGHKESGECNNNFVSSSGSMEVEAARQIWKRSVKYGLRYTTLLSDGDSRTRRKLREDAPYGPNVEIIKEECINHVDKRLGTRLRDAAKKFSLVGRKDGALTEEKIKILQEYYRKAIYENTDDLSAIIKAVRATLLHCCSSDAKPDHSLCPQGVNSWCFYNKALALNEELKSHSKMLLRLNAQVFKVIEPIYQALGSSEFFVRCARGETQNRNESLHALIWRKCLKEVFVSRNRIHAAVVNAVMERNYGILYSTTAEATLRNEEVSEVSLDLYNRIEQPKEKRKSDQESGRHTKRIKKNQEERGRLESKVSKSARKSKDYGAGCH